MKILQTLHWVQFAGTEKVCIDLCNQMSKEHEVYLFSNKISSDNHNITRIPYK
ncbi:hypothetical protein [Campylobacter sputorum]|uniref:hypothetical protein n=1 Tax=Campylobacter sputorum TaxID=206 RepID=UPI00137475D6|nr:MULTISPECIES: hypothetical protein [Campylobacter]MBE7357661.1 hypothetical protein [Campylobacter sp. RM11302]MBF6674575.1 hypothetical protein [Campylobacter sp. RM13538]MBF6676680.1 hypothetical protein [Campylobacter sp. RM12321]